MCPTSASAGPPAVPGTRAHDVPMASDCTSPDHADAASRQTAAGVAS